MLKKIVKKILYRIYQICKAEDERILMDSRNKHIEHSVSKHESSVLYPVCIVQNNLNDSSKIRIGKESRILGHLMTFGHGGEIIIGDFTFIGEGTKIWSAKKITIGNRVLISHNVNIHDNISHPLNSKDRHEDFVHIFSKGFQKTNNLREKEIIIEDDVWIGFNVTIMKGVKIGRGAIIGSNCIVLEDVPEFAVIVGNPARIIKYTN
ncbi:acyltransferase [Flavihumibacter sediminis]|nr:acyltransferase [Flavihumibacter sediminis]